MMEPDVRMETNRLGFCKAHFDLVLSRGSQLSVALIFREPLERDRRKLIFPKGTRFQPKKYYLTLHRRSILALCVKILTPISSIF